MNSKSKSVLLALCAAFGLGASPAFSGPSSGPEVTVIRGQVVRLSDGDTIVVSQDGAVEGSPESKLKIRLLGMDAPEMHVTTDEGVVGQGHWGDDALVALQKLIPPGTKVNVMNYGEDKYGRILGQIVVGKSDINLKMVELGMAIPYIICEGDLCNADYIKSAAPYFDACQRAREQDFGIFNPKSKLTEMPFEFRLRVQKRTPDKYVGNAETDALFAPGQYKKVDLCNRVFFMKLEDAKRLGFKIAN